MTPEDDRAAKRAQEWQGFWQNGPLHRLLAASRLLSASGDASLITAAFVAAACWLAPLLLFVAEDAVYRPTAWHGFLRDPSVIAKFLVAPVLLIACDRYIGRAMTGIVQQLWGIPVISSQTVAQADGALRRAGGRLSAAGPEAACLFLAAIASGLNAMNLATGDGSSWAMAPGSDGITAAAWWCVFVSSTVFWFLLARIGWRQIVWAMFLADIARMPLRLAVTHPDGHGGLGFTGAYPGGYLLFNLGVSSVVAAGVAHLMQREALTATLFTTVCAAWLVVVIAFYALPLAGFTGALFRLRHAALRDTQGNITDFERAAERKLLGSNIAPDGSETGTTDIADVKPLRQSALKMSVVLLDKTNLLPLMAGALLPIAAVGASALPFSEMMPILKRLLFL